MREDTCSGFPLQCPSAQPEMASSVIFAVIGGPVDSPQARYLIEPRPVTEALLALTKPVKPTEVFRFAAPCAERACQHFDGQQCRLAARTVELLPRAVDRLPPCAIRSNCRWWWQEGKAACWRCPAIVTETYQPTELQRQAAQPATNWDTT